MKIAQLASNFIRIPPTPRYVPAGYSGAPESIVHLLTEELVKRGHEVTLFASGDSKTKAKLISVTAKSTARDKNIKTRETRLIYELLLVSQAYRLAQNFDIIHSHLPLRSAYFAPLTNVPTVVTCHSPFRGIVKELHKKFIKQKDTQYYVSISDAQRKGLPGLNYIATVYHGIETRQIPFSSKIGSYLAICGRVTPDKGVYEAIRAAQLTKEKLIILGDWSPESKEQREYWYKKIKPNIDNKQIIYLGFISHKKVFKYLKAAKALLFPIQWEEPFGLGMIEAMACGTPVIAFRRGSVPEIVKDKRSGFIVNNIEQMAKAIRQIDQIDRRECRRYIEEKFPIKKMVDGYEKVYFQILR